ncbi:MULTISPECIES: bifunctional 23S rRNA (guanine(2069)-N(7))-methyltransferase RlmK/23S rRNA (guanine(2445)-N(2))-methyltransferase RlmL [unclassified Photobacterium]|uniref:bifunctional 23S rRNA (guanine(2069)-N(7))-methyltransferase RlmK/23S rRNA (guanine(2445)-N(2))-methyltransferase RlmL n=1 Tax=unclassified Photobacterium TaxID=2628852 RepID=UPI001EE110D1|nr:MULTISPECIES: bifunctional 23S rRNA (guanine(2069)-N(7))-methyltransferase RlmK/23S rRNA (guanine(2445)-N(2))-methyltransferase RlmL [unclassified Photobacterium]MCG3863436.1 bifunctional 23S rRNA (guanine(2069)-N(7))-methyltransferase RlmK/23S rRNA (guanine(2445)-N(2))-methyltransferase RlmL [Photobacterium sp. Ph6]MCG3874965.1 bifunctional 23S rRNA (guanine(2069)-N(7))-methyltransferase RlmK/23S rRNA (guanine(2445)-N(2))-methyltransferase RlmL [Photobacterium sp. Ph5]
MNQYLAITSRGLENLLADELEQLGAQNIQVVHAGVRFKAEQATAYRCCLWTRISSRIIQVLSEFNVRDDMDLYLGATAINWMNYFDSNTRIVVDFNGTNREIRNSQYGAMKIKDAIVDRFTKADLRRPNIDRERPDLRIHMRLSGEKGILGLDMAGSGLHQRGYRSEAGKAPLRETHAAALVMKSGWTPEQALLDPMCGSGTLVIEAAMIAAEIAPGLKRKRWGFESIKDFDQEAWLEIHAEATVKSRRGPAKVTTKFFGREMDRRVLAIARDNAGRAGVKDLIDFEYGDATQLVRPEGFETGIILCNPPYGERLGTTPELIALYKEFGNRLKLAFAGSVAAIYSGSNELLSCMRMRADKQFKLRNGALDCVLKTYLITAGSVQKEEGQSEGVIVQEEVAPDFANRLKKNITKLDKWAKREGIECYRIYDADLPNYNAAIDKYKDYLIIQEYAAPKSVSEETARRRIMDVLRATIEVTGVESNKVILKVRERQKGKNQYQKLSSAERHMIVEEYGVELKVNLYDYLDTGLFLDHRITRRMLGQMATGKDFLNLFSYTGSATVHAAVGGAKTTTTVDMSNTYLRWAQENMELNNQIGPQHEYVQADCLQWLQEVDDTFDLIFIDPPTFSNSKRMKQTFDIQRDHIMLMENLKRMLRPDGQIVFSNNKRQFKMDLDKINELGLQAKNISNKTLPMDFAKNKQIHNCWIITHKED